MKTEKVISVDDFCVYHNVKYTFVDYLAEAGLVNITHVNEIKYIPVEEISGLERMARLHTQLEINEAGVVTINNLLQKIENMQQEMSYLRNRLRIYEA